MTSKPRAIFGVKYDLMLYRRAVLLGIIQYLDLPEITVSGGGGEGDLKNSLEDPARHHLYLYFLN